MSLLFTVFYLTEAIVILWLIAYLIWPQKFRAMPMEVETESERDAKELAEEAALKKDLEENVFIEGLNVRKLQIARGGIPAVAAQGFPETLLNLGVAENRTATRHDDDHELPGDSWLSGNRPLWFGVLQFVLGLPFAVVFLAMSAFQLPFVAALAALVVATAVIVWLGWRFGAEMTRTAIRRFGKQTASFLAPGFQIVLPLIEEADEVPLMDMVWGPQERLERDDHHLEIPGSMGTKDNPSPGVFTVMLFGRWPIDVKLMITLRVRRARRQAWYDSLYEYDSIMEIGQRIAAIAHSILTTRAREVSRKVQHGLVKPAQKGDDAGEKAAAALLEFLNETPEITGAILLALQEAGKEQLAGFIPISVAMPSVVPDEKYTTLLQKVDTSMVERLIQEMEGQAAVNRLDSIANRMAQIPEKDRDIVAETIRLEVQRLFAQSGSGLDQIIKALGLKTTREATKSTKSASPTATIPTI